MQKNINRVLFIILLVLIILLGYKNIATNNPTIIEPLNTEAHTYINDNHTFAKSPEELKGEIETITKNYLLNNPDVIITAIEKWQKNKMGENQKKMNSKILEKKSELENSLPSMILGAKDGKNIVIAMYDYKCGYCKKGDVNLREITQNDKSIKVILRPFALLGEISSYATKVALSVAYMAPAKFLNIHHSLMDMEKMSVESIDELLVKNEIDIDELKKFIDSSELIAAFDQNLKLVNELGIKGAPAYIINGKMFPGLLDPKHFKEIINETSTSKK